MVMNNMLKLSIAMLDVCLHTVVLYAATPSTIFIIALNIKEACSNQSAALTNKQPTA